MVNIVPLDMSTLAPASIHTETNSIPLTNAHRWLTDLSILTIAGSFVSVAVSNSLAVIATLVAMVMMLRKQYQALAMPAWLWALLALLTVRLTASLTAIDSNLAWHYLIKEWHLLLLVPGFAGAFQQRGHSWAVTTLVIVLTVALLFAFVQLIATNYKLDWPGLRAATAVQSGSFLKQPMTLGGVSMLLLLSLGLLQLDRRWRSLVVVLALLLLLTSGARSAWLGSATAALLLALQQRTSVKWLLSGSLLLVVVLFSLPTSRDRIMQVKQQYSEIAKHRGSFGLRLDYWRAAWDLGHSKLFGVGPGNFRQAAASTPYLQKKKPPGHAHSMPMHQLAETGWPGLLAWIIWNIAMARTLYKSEHPRARFGLALMLAILTAGLFEVNQYDAEVANVYYLSLGCCLAAARQKTKLISVSQH